MTDREPAQRQLVHRLLNWDLVRDRCGRFSAIGNMFPMEAMEKCADSSPYYCHYMSWRLGTWRDESLFERLNDLISCAETLPNWQEEKRPLVASADFAEFWSLVWQLQVAEHLCRVGTDVRWTKRRGGVASLDLSATVAGQQWFVECYSQRKSFGVLGFLEDILPRIGRDISTSYDACLPFQLPMDRERASFLDEVLGRFLDGDMLADARKSARTRYPAVLCEHPGSSLCVYLRGANVDAYTPGVVPNQTGSPRFYVERVLQEAVKAKENSNGLKCHHPNLVAVSYLLGRDFQTATALREQRVITEMAPELGPNVDVLAVSTIGIDERLTRERLAVAVGPARRWNDSLSRIACRP